MTTFRSRQEFNRDVQDGVERHIWGEQEYVDGKGSVIKVNGTDTEDEEATVLVIGGASFNLAKGSNTEVMLLAGGSDTNQKYAIITTPFDKQRKWKESTGGVQHPLDGDFALEFNGKRAHVTKAKFAVGGGGELEVDGDTVYIRGNLVVSGSVNIADGISAGGTINTPGTIKTGVIHTGHIEAGSGGNNPTSPDASPTPPPGFEA